jgi:tight adherence protein B
MLAAGMAETIRSSVLIILPLIGCTLVVVGIFQLLQDLRSASQKKLLDRLKEGRTGRKKEEGPENILRRKSAGREQGALDGLVGRLSFVPKLQKILDQANVDWNATRMLINLVGIALFAGFGTFALQLGPIPSISAATGVIVLPLLVLMFMRKRRMSKLTDQLPDVFELISQALRAGHSLASGIHLVSEQLPDPAGTEFGRVFHEQNLGIRIEEALKNMADRVDMLDVRFFVTAVQIQRQTGGDLAEVLDKIGAVIRDRINLFGQVKALTAEGRMSGWTLLALPGLVFLVELQVNPKYAGMLLYDQDGRMMLFAAIVMQLMGMAMIKKIVNIKV